MTDNQKWFLLALAADIKTGGVYPVSTYMQRDDYYLLCDLEVGNSQLYTLSIEERKELIRKMKLIQMADYGRFDTVIRLTKKGWQVVMDMADEIFWQVGGWAGDFWDEIGGIAQTAAFRRMANR